MRVADAMSEVVLSVGPAHTLRQAAALMAKRRVGSAVVVDPDAAGLGILTERDVLNAIGAGLDPDVEHAAAHLTGDLVFAGPDWTLLKASEAMLRGGFRHLVVMEGSRPVGVLSVRDIVRAWAGQQSHAQV